MKTTEEQLVDLDQFLATEIIAFEKASQKAKLADRPIITQYCQGVAHAYHNARCILHVAVLHQYIEPLEVFTVMAIRQAQAGIPRRLIEDVTNAD